MDEIDVHRHVFQRLMYSDATFVYEMWMPLQGRADFVAWLNEGTLDPHAWIVIECKLDCRAIGEAIVQVWGYSSQLPCLGRVHRWIVVPESEVTPSANQFCAAKGVCLHGIDMNEPLEERFGRQPLPKRQVLSNGIHDWRLTREKWYSRCEIELPNKRG